MQAFEAIQQELIAAQASTQREAHARQLAEQEARESQQKAHNADQLYRDALQEVQRLQQQGLESANLAQRAGQLKDGTYFSNIDQVWRWEHHAVPRRRVNNFFRYLIRHGAPSFVQRRVPRGRRTSSYENTLRHANETTTVSAKSSAGSANRALWPVDVLNIHSSGQIAHLIPNSVINASMYSDVARWIFGTENFRDGDVIQKVIHGSKRSADGPRVPLTGARHFVANMIKLREQATHYDLNPGLFIVPVMTVQQMKDWNGEAYDAIVLAGDCDEFSASTVYVEIGMTSCEDEDLATSHQINTAEMALRAVVLGLHYSIRHRRDIVDDDMSDERDSSAVLNALRNRVGQSNEAIVPGRNRAEHRVRLIHFRSHSDRAGHPAPDPMLLFVKAAINWSRRNNQQVLAA
jgi:hypothetical protein